MREQPCNGGDKVRLILAIATVLLLAACPDPDARGAGEPPLDAVEMDTISWVQEGRVVEHGGNRYAPVGPPVYEPLALTHVGDFEGTPLYAERGTAAPQRRLFIPVGSGYWQMLERLEGMDPPAPGTDVPAGVEGIDPEGDPRADPQGEGPDPDLRP
jgi:hypothetical protein